MSGVTFEWDERKNLENQQKHGISFEQAQWAFSDPNRIIVEDLEHSDDEPRFFCLGKVEGGILTVRFTYRMRAIRNFGAGYWRKGRSLYGQEQGD